MNSLNVIGPVDAIRRRISISAPVGLADCMSMETGQVGNMRRVVHRDPIPISDEKPYQFPRLFWAFLLSDSQLVICIEFLNSLISPHDLHVPALVGPDGLSITQWWGQLNPNASVSIVWVMANLSDWCRQIIHDHRWARTSNQSVQRNSTRDGEGCSYPAVQAPELHSQELLQRQR